MGLRLIRGRGGIRAVYGWHHGLMLPMGLTHILAQAWNAMACRIWGHDDVLWHLAEARHQPSAQRVCCYCCKDLTGCTCSPKR